MTATGYDEFDPRDSRTPLTGHAGGRDATGRLDARAAGRAGEEAAVAALRARGDRILARNVRLRRGELDVVCACGREIVFVEVKTRRGAGYGTPAEAVTGRKRRTLQMLALAYLARAGLTGRPCRFDVVEVFLTPDGRVRDLVIIPDALGA